MKRIIAFTLSTLFFLACLTLLIVTSVMLVMGNRSEDYESATGRVTKSEINSSKCFDVVDLLGYYSPSCATIDVSYTYMVDRAEYRSTKVSFSDPSLYRYVLLPEKLREIIEPYPVGEEVLVYYDASDPDQAVLETGVDQSLFYLLAAFILLTLVSFGIFMMQFSNLVKELE